MGIFNHNSYDDHSKDDKSVVTKAQLDALSTKIDNISNFINNTKYRFYFETLGHNNDYFIRYLETNYYPFESVSGSNTLRIKKSGKYLITLNDYVKKEVGVLGNYIRVWKVQGSTSTLLHQINVNFNDNKWTPINYIGVVNFNRDIYSLQISLIGGKFDGGLYANFFIQYLGP